MADQLSALIQSAKDAVVANDFARARSAYAEAAAMARSSGDQAHLAYVLRHLSDITRSDNAAEALAQAQEARLIYRAQPDALLDLANATRLAALAHADLAQTENALADWREAGALYAQLGVEAGVNECGRRVRALGGA
ncbi:MAG: hypothetical protein QM759_04000 [Terricaulis sp.]